jgi:uncharacterized membrane protein (UPF0136 family)
MAELILPVYILLLLVRRAGLRESGKQSVLITSGVFAIALTFAGYAGIKYSSQAVLALLVVLLAVFAARLVKTRKFAPAGLLVILTVAAAPPLSGHPSTTPWSADPGRRFRLPSPRRKALCCWAYCSFAFSQNPVYRSRPLFDADRVYPNRL